MHKERIAKEGMRRAQAVEGLVNKYIQKLDKSLSTALDPRKLGPAAAGQSGLLGTPGGARSAAAVTPGSSAKLNEVCPCAHQWKSSCNLIN
jgi:hypothetical protein